MPIIIITIIITAAADCTFSSAGWFCRLGRCDERRPVSVLRFIEVCTRPLLSGSVCSGRMKATSIVSSALASVSALSAPSAATAASAPCVRCRCERTAPDLTSSPMAPEEVDGVPPLVSLGGGTPSPLSSI
jgi:hypothetical protein